MFPIRFPATATLLWVLILVLATPPVQAQNVSVDTLTDARPRFLHQISVEARPEYLCPTNPFLRGMNQAGKRLEAAGDIHLRYGLRFRPGSRADRTYGGAYQGVGIARYELGNRSELGNPVALYLFQGARIARISPRFSLNYEWNFGLSYGWKPYDEERNPANKMIGSKLNAYLNADFYFAYLVGRRIDLSAGVALTHFSNGNTKYPNAGLNAVGMKVGMTYHFGDRETLPTRREIHRGIDRFDRHVSYDLVFFASWRRKGVQVGDKQYAAPRSYPVAGFNFAPMYNFGYKFRAGISLDGVYDGSANVYAVDKIVPVGSSEPMEFAEPSLDKQLALGVSVRGEFVMPYFTIGLGLGANVLHKGGDLDAYYQMLTLKIAATRHTFIHIGYCLKDFQTPNYLMLGVGVRFNNHHPRMH